MESAAHVGVINNTTSYMEGSTTDSYANYLTPVSEIVEDDDNNGDDDDDDDEIRELSTSDIRSRALSSVGDGIGGDVYVAVGRSKTTTNALAWALENIATLASFVYLIHVFPEVHYIRTPLGKLPKSQVTPSHVEIHMSLEKKERDDMMQKFFNLCISFKVNVDTILIESDFTTKAILDLIPILHIKTLVLGTTKTNLRKGSGKAIYIQKNAPEYCQVRMICDGKEATEEMISSLSPSSSHRTNSLDTKSNLQAETKTGSNFCTCFSGKFK